LRTRKINRRTFLQLAAATAAVGAVGGLASQLGWDDNILLGLSRSILPIPRAIWRSQVRGKPQKIEFMTKDHHRVRDFVVVDLPRVGKPLPPDYIAEAMQLPQGQVVEILGDLERHMEFVFRNPAGAVVWAYPVTADNTPHHVTFSTGERINAA
jgi:hypothetical protein